MKKKKLSVYSQETFLLSFSMQRELNGVEREIKKKIHNV